MTLVLVLLIVAVLLIGPILPVRYDHGWICAYTGSRKGHTTWLWCITTSEYYRKSPIEQWLEKNHKPIEHEWVRVVGTAYCVFGGWRRHAEAPPLYLLMPQTQEWLVQHGSAEEIEGFLRVLKDRTPDEARRAVDVLTETSIAGE